MEETVLIQPRSVLIVDRSEETREVLTTALERRGMRILSASRPDRGLQLARQHHPDLIVLGLEAAAGEADEVCEPFAAQSRESQSALVVLGSIRRDCPHPPGGEFIAKPYHYGPLVRKIEELLLGASRDGARCA